MKATGTVERRGDRRYRVRASIKGKRIDLGTYPTEEIATAVLAAALRKVEGGGYLADGPVSLADIRKRFLEDRKRASGRDMQPERSRWTNHIATAPFAEMPMRDVTSKEVREWARSLLDKVSRGTALICLSLMSTAWEWAIEQEIADANPVRGVKLPRERVTHEPWTYLAIEEQRALLAVVPEPERWLVMFAMLTGMRRGEQWALRLVDLHVGPRDAEPFVVVRHGTLDGPTKGRRMRTLPLMPPAAEAARRWLAALPSYARRNRHALAFPGRGGAHRRTKPPREWHVWVKLAGIGRRVRWHDLRHTFGASVVSGVWGDAWRLEVVREYLGHATIRQTERYAHLGATAIKSAASGTMALSLAPQKPLQITAKRSRLLCSARA